MGCYNIWNRFGRGVEHIKNGQPQGSIPGPLLFIKYIIDIFQIFNFDKFILYADDTYSTITSSNITEVNEQLNVL